jgi:pimeloyl-ACP methyl ester carboxylesterase
VRPGLGSRARVARLVLVAALGATAVTALPAMAAAKSGCTGAPSQVLSTTKVLGLTGSYTLPVKAPSAIVVFAHGFRSSSAAWQKAMIEASAKHNAIAVAVDYRGLLPVDESYGGWPVKAGSEDLVKAAATFKALCPGIATTALYSVGMGGDAAGLALAHNPARFTYWVDVEGATDLYGVWTSLSAFGGVCLPTGNCLPGLDTYYATVRSEIEDAAGGTPYEDQAGFDALDAMTQIRSAGSLGLKGVAVVHAVADASVLYAEAASMTGLLRTKSVPTDTYTVGRGNGGPDRTIGGAAGAGGADPMAGYEPDGANGAIVIKTGLTALWGMIDKGGVKPADQLHVVNG